MVSKKFSSVFWALGSELLAINMAPASEIWLQKSLSLICSVSLNPSLA